MKSLIAVWSVAVLLCLFVQQQVAMLDEKVVSRVKAMGKQVNDAQTFRERFERMRPVEKEFNESLPAKSKGKDVFSIYELLGIDTRVIDAAPEKMSVSSVTEVLQNEKSIGVMSVCLSSGAGHLLVKTEDLDASLRNLELLAAKPWISITEIAVETIPGRPTVFIQLYGFCTLMRDET